MIGTLIRRDVGNLSLSLTMSVCVLGRHSEEEVFTSQEKSSHLKSDSEEN